VCSNHSWPDGIYVKMNGINNGGCNNDKNYDNNEYQLLNRILKGGISTVFAF
jgi:hypothetical protein